MKFVLKQKSSSNQLTCVAYQVKPSQWYVLSESKGFFTATLKPQISMCRTIVVPQLEWKHAEYLEETEGINFYFQQYNSGWNEHFFTVSATCCNKFAINPTETFLHYLQSNVSEHG